jgi:hypothetical protein
MLVSDYIDEVVHGIPIIIDIKMLPSGTYTIVFTGIVTRTSFHGRFVVIK